jgi:glycosyl transferase family 87
MSRAAVAAGIVLVGAVPRLLLSSGTLPAWLTPFVWSDLLYTWQRGLSGGRIPYWETYFEYPPLDGYLAGMFSAMTRSAFVYVALWTVVQVAAAFVVGVALAPYGRRAWLWAAAPQLALFGPINFDLLAVAGLVLAVRWSAARAPMRAIAALAVGTAAKLFPLAALPVILLRSRPRSAIAQLALFGFVLAALYLPALTAPFSSLESLQRYSVGIRANFDSFWGLIATALDGVGVPSAQPILWITGLGLLLTYVLAVVPAARSTRDPAVPISLAVVSLVLWSRLYSPQYSLWVLPFFAFVPIPLRWYLVLTAADVTVFLTVYPLGLVHWPASEDPLGTALFAFLAAAVAVRQIALLGMWRALRRQGHLRLQTSNPPTTSWNP